MIAVWSETSFTELDLCSILTEEKKDSLQLFFFFEKDTQGGKALDFHW